MRYSEKRSVMESMESVLSPEEKVGKILHRVSKNVPPTTCYNLDIHNLITIIFGRSVTEKVRNNDA